MTAKPGQCFRMCHTPELKAQYVADWGRLTADSNPDSEELGAYVCVASKIQ